MTKKVGCIGCLGLPVVLLGLLIVMVQVGQRIGPSTATGPTTAGSGAIGTNLTVVRLGDTREKWVTARGEPSKGIVGEKFGSDTEVFWREGTDGSQRASHIELLFAQEVPVAQARLTARELLPLDTSSKVGYSAPAGQTVDVFHSVTLSEVFPPSLFEDEEPGTFIQIAERGSPTTGRVVIALGNRP